MVAFGLNNSAECQNFFQQGLLINLEYWLDYVTAQQEKLAALDRERENIIKAISQSFQLNVGWPMLRDLIIKFSPYMERRGYWESWNWVLDQAVALASRRDDTSGVATLSALYARLLRQQSRIKEAIKYDRQSIKFSRQLGDEFGEARACTNLGYAFIEAGYWHRAEVLCCHALQIFERIDSDHGRAHTENHLGILYTRQCKWEKAYYHLKKACDIWQGIGDDSGLTRGYINLGSLYNDMEEGDKALHWLEKALNQANLAGEVTQIGSIYNNIGNAYLLLNRPDQAELYMHQAETIVRRFSQLIELGKVQHNLGRTYLLKQRWEKADGYFQEALKLKQRLDDRYDEINILIDLVENELGKNNIAQAKAYLLHAEQCFRPVWTEVSYKSLRTRLTEYSHKLMTESSS